MWAGLRGSLLHTHLFDDDLAALVYGAVVDHVYNRNPEVAADSEGNAEAQAAHDGDDIAPRQSEAGAVKQRRFPLSHVFGAAIFRQLDHFARFLLLLNNSGNETFRNFRIARPQSQQTRGVPDVVFIDLVFFVVVVVL